MKPCNERAGGSRAQGTVLLLTLVFMLMLSIVAITMLQSAVLQLHMAANSFFQEQAFQEARAVLTELSSEESSYVLKGGVGYTRCSAESQRPDCDSVDLNTPKFELAGNGAGLHYRIMRQPPLVLHSILQRESQGDVSSALQFQGAVFELEVSTNGGERNVGSARVAKGVVVRLAALR